MPAENRHLVELAALLPQRVIENLVAERRLGRQVKPRFATKSIEGALLFIDVSGFTASMEIFAQQGSKGIEKFWKMFNAYFRDLLDVIQVGTNVNFSVLLLPFRPRSTLKKLLCK